MSPPSIRRKLGLQVVVSNAETMANFALSIILARLLTPTEIGLFALSAVLISFAHVFRDFGVFAFLIKEKEIDEQKIRTAYGVLLVSSWSVAAILFLSAGAWSAFFKVAEVEDVVRVLALGFVFIPFGSIPYALLTRDLEVKRISMVKLISTVGYFSISILLARSGFGHMTMAWANLAGILIGGVAYHWYSTTRVPWLPSLKGWKNVVRFGAGTIATSTIGTLNAELPGVMLGRLGTPAQVGFYGKAESAVALPYTVLQSTVNHFALPYLSKIHNASAGLAHAFVQASAHLCVLIIPVMAWTAVMRESIILFLFGPQWEASVHAIPWLCLAGAIGVMFRMVNPALISMGRPYVPAFPELVSLLAKIGIGIALFDGTLVSFAIAVLLGQLLAAPVHLHIIRRHFSLGLLEWARPMVKILFIAAVCGAGSQLALALLPDGLPHLVRLLVTGGVFAVLWLGSVMLLKPPIEPELRLVFAAVRRKLRGA